MRPTRQQTMTHDTTIKQRTSQRTKQKTKQQTKQHDKACTSTKQTYPTTYHKIPNTNNNQPRAYPTTYKKTNET